MVIFDEMHAREVLKEMFGDCNIFDYISEGMSAVRTAPGILTRRSCHEEQNLSMGQENH